MLYTNIRNDYAESKSYNGQVPNCVTEAAFTVQRLCPFFVFSSLTQHAIQHNANNSRHYLR